MQGAGGEDEEVTMLPTFTREQAIRIIQKNERGMPASMFTITR